MAIKADGDALDRLKKDVEQPDNLMGLGQWGQLRDVLVQTLIDQGQTPSVEIPPQFKGFSFMELDDALIMYSTTMRERRESLGLTMNDDVPPLSTAEKQKLLALDFQARTEGMSMERSVSLERMSNILYYMVSAATEANVKGEYAAPTREQVMYDSIASECWPIYAKAYGNMRQVHIQDQNGYKISGADYMEQQRAAGMYTEALDVLKAIWDRGQMPSNEKVLSSRIPERIAWRVTGETVRDGQSFHYVAFEHACDRKVWGKDEPIANAYLISRRDGTHDLLLSDETFNRLRHYSRVLPSPKLGMGVTDVTLVRGARGKPVPDLSESAEEKGLISVPAYDFNPLAHDRYIEQSRSARYASLTDEQQAEGSDVEPEY